MSWTSLGKITVSTPGQPQSAVTNVSASGPMGENQQRYSCMAILFQAWSGNTGKTYILDSVLGNKTTGAGLLATLPIPTANLIPSAGATIPNAPAALNAAEYFIDSDVPGDGVSVSILVA